MRDPSRRETLRLLGGIAGLGALPVNFVASAGCNALAINSLFRPTPQKPLTPTVEFYINENFGKPDIPAVTDWRLHVQGLVHQPLALDLAGLKRFPTVEKTLTMECIGNIPEGGLISSSSFAGVRMRDVLAEAGISDRAFGVKFLGLDGYPVYLPIAACVADEAMLVHTMNGAPLDIEHGTPLRALFPGRYGMFSCKWLDSITLTREQGLWSSFRGVNNVVEGRMHTRSRIDFVQSGATANRQLRVGHEVTVAGLAVAAGRGIEQVELWAEDQWRPAELSWNRVREDGNPYLWTLWRVRFTPQRAGAQSLSVRATDLLGQTQSDRAEFPYDSGVIHTVRIVVHE